MTYYFPEILNQPGMKLVGIFTISGMNSQFLSEAQMHGVEIGVHLCTLFFLKVSTMQKVFDMLAILSGLEFTKESMRFTGANCL